MSLPLTRRIARAVLLLAAAAPVIGAAGAASAAGLPQTPDLGLSNLNSANLSSTLDGTAQQGAKTLNETGGKLVGTTVPVATKTVKQAGELVAPEAKEKAGKTTGETAEVLGGAANKATGGSLPVERIAGALPLGG
ncbi:ATP-binding protein [Streptomyces sp. NBC_00102]|uniref:ATP-binding protein n=1 Tax=Streptomyces sp. NBC_00102 TaxID=2975652 RepID=UPI00224CC3ED|nr:ATP-binding protein [Streptomyces sp. NBC_00102]MCX5399544.1 ATP-binding protein [Streptomyces sp. NBC_00102]